MPVVVPGRWKIAFAALLALGAVPAFAQDTAYKCVSRGTVTYSQVPCPGGRAVTNVSSRTTDKWKVPPQDRAVLARRARLTPEEREQCGTLDHRMAREQEFLKSKGEAATLDDEMPLVRMKKQFRELRC